MKLFFIIIIFSLLIGGVFLLSSSLQPNEDKVVLESTGRDKQVPAQNIGNVLEKADRILITNPTPNQVVSSPLVVEGQARGTWFFEGSFPVKLLTTDGTVIARGVAEAQGAWMTTEFVPYRVTLRFTGPASGQGTLVLEKDNPSGLLENADALTIPVSFSSPSSF